MASSRFFQRSVVYPGSSASSDCFMITTWRGLWSSAAQNQTLLTSEVVWFRAVFLHQPCSGFSLPSCWSFPLDLQKKAFTSGPDRTESFSTSLDSEKSLKLCAQLSLFRWCSNYRPFSLKASSSTWPASGKFAWTSELQVMGQDMDQPPDIRITDHQLDVVHDFVYLTSTISDALSLDSELNWRIGKACPG